MTLRQYVFLMLFGTVICWVSWGMVVNNLDPHTGGWVGFAFFYSSLFLSLVGTFALTGLGFRLYILRHDVVFRQVAISFRQALSFALLIVAGLFLQSKGLLTWWNMLFLVAALTLIEMAIVFRQRPRLQ